MKFAGLLTLRGSPSDPPAQRVFDGLVPLLLARGPGLASKGRIQQLGINLDLIPLTPEGLDRIAAAVEAAAKIENVEQATFPLEVFVKVALQLPKPMEYVEVSKKRKLDSRKIATVFCQDTLTWVKVRFRGVVGDYMPDPGFSEQVRGIKTIR